MVKNITLKFGSILLAIILLAVGIVPVWAAENQTIPQIFKGSRYHEITTDEANRMFQSGKSFILIYYSSVCGITLSRAAMFQQLIDEYGVDIYGLNGLYQPGTSWIFDKFKNPEGRKVTVSYPIVCTVINNNDYTCLDGNSGLSEQLIQISNFMIKTKNIKLTDTMWQGFYKLNSSIRERKRNDPEALKSYLSASGSIQENDPEIVRLSKEITSKHVDSYDKLKAIHDWVADNIFYDLAAVRPETDDYYSSKEKDYSAKGTLTSKRAVCIGYANLSAALARSAGIPCKVVTGFADGRSSTYQFNELFPIYNRYMATGDEKLFSEVKSNHAWNEAFVDQRWVIFDTTWDSNNEYLDNDEFANTSSDKFFDLDLKVFSDSHAQWKSEFFDDQIGVNSKTIINAIPTTSSTRVNGAKINFSAYNINGSNYFKLRDLAYLLKKVNSDRQFEVVWNNITKTISILTSKVYTPVGGELEAAENTSPQIAVFNYDPILINGKKIELTAYTIKSNNFIKLRDIASIINFDVDWDGTANTIIIEPNKDYTTD